MPLKVTKQAAPVLMQDQRVADLYQVTADLLRGGATNAVVAFVNDTLAELAETVLPALTKGHERSKTLIEAMMWAFHSTKVTFELHIGHFEDLVQLEQDASHAFDYCRDDDIHKCDLSHTCETERTRLWNIYEETEYEYKSVVSTIKRQWCEASGDRSEAAWRESTENRFEHFITIGEERITKLEAHDEWSTRCAESKRSLSDAVAVCAQRKRQLEQTSCKRSFAFHRAVGDLDVSWQTASESYSEILATLKPQEGFRFQQFKSLKGIECLLKHIIARSLKGCDEEEEPGEYESILGECADHWQSEPAPNLTYPEVPKRPDKPDSGPTPCSQEYISLHYSDNVMDGQCFASMPSCASCPEDASDEFSPPSPQTLGSERTVSAPLSPVPAKEAAEKETAERTNKEEPAQKEAVETAAEVDSAEEEAAELAKEESFGGPKHAADSPAAEQAQAGKAAKERTEEAAELAKEESFVGPKHAAETPAAEQSQAGKAAEETAKMDGAENAEIGEQDGEHRGPAPPTHPDAASDGEHAGPAPPPPADTQEPEDEHSGPTPPASEVDEPNGERTGPALPPHADDELNGEHSGPAPPPSADAHGPDGEHSGPAPPPASDVDEPNSPNGEHSELAPSPAAEIHEPQECSGGQVWISCGSACPPTCEDENPICTQECMPACECPSERRLLQEGVCISYSQCAHHEDTEHFDKHLSTSIEGSVLEAMGPVDNPMECAERCNELDDCLAFRYFVIPHRSCELLANTQVDDGVHMVDIISFVKKQVQQIYFTEFGVQPELHEISFEMVDSDGDEEITGDEFDVFQEYFFKKLLAEWYDAFPSAGRRLISMQVFSLMDLDGDGLIDRAEGGDSTELADCVLRNLEGVSVAFTQGLLQKNQEPTTEALTELRRRLEVPPLAKRRRAASGLPAPRAGTGNHKSAV